MNKLITLAHCGNWSELCKASQRILDAMDVRDIRAGWVWNKLCQGLMKANRAEEYDGLFQKYALGKYSGNLSFLVYDMEEFTHCGYLIDNKFRRGELRGNGGRYATSFERDRVQQLAILTQLLPKAETPEWDISVYAAPDDSKQYDKQTLRDLFYLRMAVLLLQGRDSGNSYRLQELTDLEEIPDYKTEEGKSSSLSRPPVNADGTPLFYRLLENWSEAVNDGERLRFVLDRAMRSQNPEALLLWANFLCGQFDFLTVEDDFREEFYLSPAMKESLYALRDNESITELANGTRRIALPDEFNYIEMFKKACAHGELAEIHASRMQFEQAAVEFLKAGRNEEANAILQAWGKPEAPEVLPAGVEITIPYHFRNASQVNVKLYRVHSSRVVSRMLKDYEESHFSFYEKRLPEELPAFLRETGEADFQDVSPVLERTFELSPLPHHWETTEYLKFNPMKPGMFIARFTPDKNLQSQCEVLLWIAEEVLTLQTAPQTFSARIFLNDAVTGAPIPERKVTIRSFEYSEKKGIMITYNTTDAKGMVELDSTILKELKRYDKHIIVSEDDEGNQTLLKTYDFTTYDRNDFDVTQHVFMIADKTAYKPGDTIAFTGYVRRPSYGDDRFLANNREVKLTFFDPQGNESFSQRIDFHQATQSFTFETKLPEDAMLGQWTVNVDSFYGQTSFVVEEYKKPEYLLEVSAPKKPMKAGEKIPVVIQAKYYFGAPLANAEVNYKVFREETASLRPFAFIWNWLYGERYAFCSTAYEDDIVRTCNLGEVTICEGKGKTNDEGLLTLEVDSAYSLAQYGQRNFRYRIEAEVMDSTNRMVSGTGEVMVAAKPFEVSLYLPWGFAKTGQRQEVQIAAHTANGDKIKGAGMLRIYRKERNGEGVSKRVDEPIKSIPFTPNGPENPFFILNVEGVYEVEAEVISEDGNQVAASSTFCVAGERQGEQLFGDAPLTIAADKPEYRPGDVAEILVSCNTPHRTVYFFTRSERDATVQCVTLNGYSRLFSVPVETTDQPNFFVMAMTFQNGRMQKIQKQIIVPPERKILNVTAKPAADKVKPGTILPLKIKVTGLDGKPVSGAVTITVYDKSLESISDGEIPQILPFFWNWRRQNVMFFDNSFDVRLRMWEQEPGMEQAIESNYSRLFIGGDDADNEMLMPGCCCASIRENCIDNAPEPPSQCHSKKYCDIEKQAASDSYKSISVRTHFLDRAFWAGRLELPENGETTVEIPVPDNMTTWVVRAWSLTPDTRVGEARTEFVASKDLIARLELPRFMTQGDIIQAVVSLNNLTDKDMDAVTATLAAPGLLKTDCTRILAVKAGGTASFQVPLTASAVGEFPLILRATSELESDALELKLPVLVRGIDKQINACGRLDAMHRKTTIMLDIPWECRPETKAFALHLSPGAARNMMELLPYLAAKSSDDIFSITNQCLPPIAAKLALQTLGVSWKDISPKKTTRSALFEEYMRDYYWSRNRMEPTFRAEDFKRIVAENLQKLGQMVNADGGWGWLGMNEGHSWPDTTASVVDALLELEEAKCEGLDDKLIENGVQWLQRHAVESIADILEYDRVTNIDCLVARVLAKAGHPNTELMEHCYEKRLRCLSPYGIAMLALAYPANSDKAKMLMRNLDQFLKSDDENGTAYLNIPSSCCFYWYGEENETLSACLELLLREDPRGITAQKVANYLVTNVRNSPWRNSVRSLGAAVRALARYIVASGEEYPNFTVTVKAGEEEHVYTFTQKNFLQNEGPALFLPADKLSEGRHQVELEFSGQGALYWNSMLSYFSMEEEIPPAGLEMKIRRNYYRLEQNPDASTALAGKGGAAIREKVLKYKRIPLRDGDVVKAGDLLEVELISTSKNDYDYVVFQDAMPAGFEHEKPVSGWIWHWKAPVYAEYRERGAKFYLRNMVRGESNVFYRIRAQLPGTVIALQARGYGLYAPELKCNSAQCRILTET